MNRCVDHLKMQILVKNEDFQRPFGDLKVRICYKKLLHFNFNWWQLVVHAIFVVLLAHVAAFGACRFVFIIIVYTIGEDSLFTFNVSNQTSNKGDESKFPQNIVRRQATEHINIPGINTYMCITIILFLLKILKLFYISSSHEISKYDKQWVPWITKIPLIYQNTPWMYQNILLKDEIWVMLL